MRPSAKTGPSQRQLRVGEQLRHIIAETMQRGHFRDERLLKAGNITVTEVRVTPDLKNAKAYVMALGGMDMDDILPALNESASLFQKEINRQSNLKFTPKVSFRTDTSFDEAQKIDDLLRGIHYADQDEDQG
ncbi:MAG: 30S ribosome-binding factor RbfA [Alphaproteobacteria bacterium]|nr:30S ribosome-binding factor RbfA [Alphaproteobacteria bacterium]